MKRKNADACDEARFINAKGDRPIEHLDSDLLDRHLENVYLFKLGLLNSFGIDFRHQTHFGKVSSDTGSARPVLFNYLSEVLPLVQVQANRLPVRRKAAYDNLADAAINSFWEIYYRFQPLIHRQANKSGVDVDDLGNILGRAILLYDKKRGFKFFSYLEKTLRESTKNLRGRIYAQRLGLPLSAGRLMPQILWLVDRETLRLGRCLSIAESESVVLRFLHEQPARFAEETMMRIAHAARTQVRPLMLDTGLANTVANDRIYPTDRRTYSPDRQSHNECTNSVEAQDEYDHLLSQIAQAVEKAAFSEREKAILLQRLDVSHDKDLYTQVESE